MFWKHAMVGFKAWFRCGSKVQIRLRSKMKNLPKETFAFDYLVGEIMAYQSNDQ